MPTKVSELKIKKTKLKKSSMYAEIKNLNRIMDDIINTTDAIIHGNKKRKELMSKLNLLQEQDNFFPTVGSDGVTKREQFAVNILHAFVEGSIHLGHRNGVGEKERIQYAEASVKYADALINALKKVEPKQLPGPSKPKQRR